MTKEELKTRKIIWESISNFYLDTELDDKEYDYISKKLIETKIEIEELKLIDLYEVFPTLQMNLLSPAGEWAGFEPTWLNQKCLINYEKRISSKSYRVFTEMKNKLFFWMREKHWKEINKRIKSNT